jgi:hypothetical protein
MVPKINAKGKSFKGLAAYLLHDKDGAATSGRVAWVETVNLLTGDPDLAWRAMAATAMAASYLKAQAGVKKTGRNSNDSALHISLSWDPTENPDRKEMAAFARRALQAIKADDRQAMVICHTDTKYPHVHLIINRVSPTDGRMLPGWNEKMALSTLALAYEKENGAVLCPERAVNMAKRAKGEFVRGKKDIPRPEFEAMRAEQLAAEKSLPAQVLKENPNLLRKTRAVIKEKWRTQLDAIKKDLRGEWRDLYQRQRAETQEGHEAKASFIGRMKNWFTGGDRSGSPALAFQKESLAYVIKTDDLRDRNHRMERASLSQRARQEIRKAVGELRPLYETLLRRVTVGHDLGRPRPEPKPAGQSPAPPSPAEQRRLELAEKFRAERKPPEPEPPPPPRPRGRDWEREP